MIDTACFLAKRFRGNDESANSLNKGNYLELLDYTAIYDDSFLMAGRLTGTQAQIREVCPKANFIHCTAHCLNLVLSQSCGFIEEVKIFFTTLSSIPAFFQPLL